MRFGVLFYNFFMMGKNIYFKKIFTSIVVKSNYSNSTDYIPMLYNYSKIDHYERAKSIKNRVLLIIGEKTLKMFKKSGVKLNKFLEYGEIVIIKASKHFILSEKSSEICNKI